jgi:hypothetical protein
MISQISDNELICSGLRKLGAFQVNSAHPKSFIPESANQVAPNETTSTVD